MAIKQEVMILSSAFRQSLEMDANPGNTVQSSQNPAQVHLNGFFNLQQAATRAYEALVAYHDAAAAQLMKDAEIARKAAVVAAKAQADADAAVAAEQRAAGSTASI